MARRRTGKTLARFSKLGRVQLTPEQTENCRKFVAEQAATKPTKPRGKPKKLHRP
jgi:hypothetical protein